MNLNLGAIIRVSWTKIQKGQTTPHGANTAASSSAAVKQGVVLARCPPPAPKLSAGPQLQEQKLYKNTSASTKTY